jgi:hypothetical protein
MWIDSTETEEHAIKIIQEVIEVNPVEYVSDVMNVNLKVGEKYQRVLGLLWIPKNNCFIFSTDFSKIAREIVKIPTKREALSVIMSIFDPLGIATRITIRGRILLQKIWKAGIGWGNLVTHIL